jgi:glycosyltransferase involved in cell wall biosynthesis
MKQIAVLIPTFGRPHKLDKLIANFKRNSKQSTLYFIIDPIDKLSKEKLKPNSNEYSVLSIKGEYQKAINYGYKNTKEPFIFCGADDILFTKGWEEKLLNIMEDEKIMVTGGIDDWVCSGSGVHTSHPLIRRTYIDDIGCPQGYKGYIYNPNRQHYHIDIELEQVAWHRGVIKICKECVIEHNHFFNKKAEKDSTYDRSYQLIKSDTEHYLATYKNFEYWNTNSLQNGLAVPSEFRKKKLSIIMPIWNCREYVDKTINSLLKNTKHKYELILIDDNSNEFDGKKYLKELYNRTSSQFITVKTILNTKQNYTNYNWNLGVNKSTGDFIAIINSDIELLTEEWDDYLIECLELGYELVNPYQTDDVYNCNYMKPPQDDFLYRYNIRGACFMMSRRFVDRVFPIPKKLIHWFGDNYISQKLKDWLYDIRVVIKHYISQSARTMKMQDFWGMVYKDSQEYKKLFPDDDISPVENNIKSQLKYYAKV